MDELEETETNPKQKKERTIAKKVLNSESCTLSNLKDGFFIELSSTTITAEGLLEMALYSQKQFNKTKRNLRRGYIG